MTKKLTWLYDKLYHPINEGRKLDIDEINIDGSYECGKTYACMEIILKCLTVPGVSAVFVRRYKYQRFELEQAVLDLAKELNLVIVKQKDESGFSTYKVLESNNRIRFLHTDRRIKISNENNFSGLSPFPNSKYILIFIDEAYEVKEKDKTTILSKVRGQKDTQLCMLQCCNPYSLSNDFVKYCNSQLPYNKPKLMKYGFDIVSKDYVQKNHKIFSHINVLACNDIMNKDKWNKINESCARNRKRAITIKYGIPSYDEESVYGAQLDLIGKPVYHYVDRVICGIDVGIGTNRNAGITACYIGFWKNGIGVDFFNEYTQDNREHKKSITERANEIINFVYNSLREYRFRTQYTFNLPYCYINVDWSSGDFIDRLNELILERRLDKIMWARANQKNLYKINERIDWTIDWIRNKKLRIDFDKCKKLFEEMSTMKLIISNDDKEATQRQSSNDHCINAFEYAMEEIWEKEKMIK